MSKIDRPGARLIVCDALSGSLTRIANEPASEEIAVNKALGDLYNRDPDESLKIYGYIRKRVKILGWPFDMTPDLIEMPNYQTVGDLITLVQIATEREEDDNE